mmetsp:Transcript_17729/g.30533  ORF Transcript_17729/g.30533 Transcript_17729/m.30533 type:complete len:88 (-) Transcript_17729:1464-1727(-)
MSNLSDKNEIKSRLRVSQRKKINTVKLEDHDDQLQNCSKTLQGHQTRTVATKTRKPKPTLLCLACKLTREKQREGKKDLGTSQLVVS